MNTSFWNKATLYIYVNELASSLNITEDDFPVNAEYLARKHCNNVTIEQVPFPSADICGILYKGSRSTSIALNASRSDAMRNFDCMHELIHYFFHDIEDRQYICFASGDSGESSIVQDSYVEWQANEGAAQFLVPYEKLLPLIKKRKHDMDSQTGICSLRKDLACTFNVTEDVIRVRLESLKYEIHQYLNGCGLDKIHILSAKKQNEKGITVKSLNNIAIDRMHTRFEYELVSESEKELLDDLKFGFGF